MDEGAARAHNIGIDNCVGDYLVFVDSDDWLSINAIELLVSAVLRDDADMCVAQLKRVFSETDNCIVTDEVAGYQILGGQNFLRKCITIPNVGVSVCARIYKKSCF